jgi:tRNA pseudouridine32 synthase/23S rRNA pseudouridine746 synthase/23S rRNA pseudouridine1911/1915/1917 synthase
MNTAQQSFKPVPKKFQPSGLTILYEDRDILVVNKENGLLTVSIEGQKERTAYWALTDYVKKGNPKSKNRVFIVHRLDRDTSGVLVFAKTEDAKIYLQENWGEFSKTYFAVVHGTMEEKEGIITSYLVENAMHRVFSTTDPEKGKFAKTGYKVIKESPEYSLLEIALFTGRKNQIRVHMAEKGHPIAADRIYGKSRAGGSKLALHAGSLTINHPHSKKQMTFEAELPAHIKTLVKNRESDKPAKPKPENP